MSRQLQKSMLSRDRKQTIEAILAENGNSWLSANNQTGSFSIINMRMKANVINLDYSRHHLSVILLNLH